MLYYNVTQYFFSEDNDMGIPATEESVLGTGIGLAVLIEVGLHILVHYTVPGATAAAALAQTLAPGLDAVGLTTVFSDASAAASSTTELASLPSLDTLAPSLDTFAAGPV
ncbi:MAG: hypothetical protein R3D66_05520 [Alphaproteobacteria bacterium]